MRLLFGQEEIVWRWARNKYGFDVRPTHIFGLIDSSSGVLKGCFTLNAITSNTAEFGIFTDHSIGGCGRALFRIAFDRLGYGRLEVMIDKANLTSRKQTPRWGFKFDGTAKDYLGPGRDVLRFVMLRKDCRWLKGAAHHGTIQEAEGARANGRKQGQRGGQRAEHV